MPGIKPALFLSEQGPLGTPETVRTRGAQPCGPACFHFQSCHWALIVLSVAQDE